MYYYTSITLFVFFLLVLVIRADMTSDTIQFDVNYQVSWGYDHVMSLDQGRQIQLSMDKSTGSGFVSKSSYGYGFFQMKMKLHNGDTAGVVTTFYLISNTTHHDELDLEFLGNTEGKSVTLQTNIYVNGTGNREQRMYLWFDPSADFHTYKILWNQHQIVFYVDDVAIRVLKNNQNQSMNCYPSQAMQVTATLWNGEDWATDGGRTKINWSDSPFKAHFQDFGIDGCKSPQGSSTQQCYPWWNDKQFWDLSVDEQKAYEEVRNKYMYYDYCTDKSRYTTVPPECV